MGKKKHGRANDAIKKNLRKLIGKPVRLSNCIGGSFEGREVDNYIDGTLDFGLIDGSNDKSFYLVSSKTVIPFQLKKVGDVIKYDPYHFKPVIKLKEKNYY